MASIDGKNLTPLVEDSTPREGPTWEGGDSLVYVSAAYGDFEPTILMRIPAAGGEPQPLTDGSTGWDSHPDWSETGLLFLRSPGGDKKGDVFLLDADDRLTRLTTVRNAESPTWSPDGSRLAYLAPGSEGRLSVWIQEPRRDATATEIPVDGTPGPPAWGPR